MIMLEAKALSIGYGRTLVASELHLSLHEGTITTLLGPNGIGKTTLFKTLLGLMPALGGEIRLGGMDLARLDRQRIARRMAYVPQAHPADFAYTVLDLVVMGRTAYLGTFSGPRPTDYALARDALERLGIGALAERESIRISGGQRQLALIARALAQQAPLIVMDEPTASLDLGNRILVLDTIRRLADGGHTIVLSTHEPEHAFAVSDRVALLGLDNEFVTGAVDEVLTAERLSRLYGVSLVVERTASGKTVVGAASLRPTTND